MRSLTGWIFLVASCMLLCGCQHGVGLQNVGPDGRISYEDAFIFNGALSAETVNLLGNHLLYSKIEASPQQFINELERLCEMEPTPRFFIAIAETSQLLAARMQDDPDTAIKYNLTTLIYTQKYFQYAIDNRSSLLFDPEAIVAVRCYNLALTELFSYLKQRNMHRAGAFELTAAGGQKIHFELPKFSLPVKEDHIIAFELCADYRPVNLTHNSRRFGIGVPLVCEMADHAIPETNFAEGQVIPATLAMRIENDPDDASRRTARLYFLDSRSVDEVTVGEVTVPLAQDFSTPLAYMVKNPPPFDFLQRTFQIELTSGQVGLYHLEPHNDNRIPVVLVHGLLSDIRTWLQLINTLQSDPELRRNYRFMGFSYSSGNPIFVSAMHLRQALLAERARLEHDGRDLTKFDQMILIGHSMGGLISRLMISRSDDKLLAGFIGEDIYQQAVDSASEEFRNMMIFEPVLSVKRVIFIAVPHRGSELAQSWFAQAASSMIEVPSYLLEFNRKLISGLIDMPEAQKYRMMGTFTGIDNLSPTGSALRLLNLMPICAIPYHSIIGNTEQRGIPGGSDGVVPYSSSHLDGAVSEIVVQSGHSVQQNPLAIQEIKRILKEHLRTLDHE